jgi:hypothetical protein
MLQNVVTLDLSALITPRNFTGSVETVIQFGRDIIVPFKSQAQRAKFAQLVKDGKMSQAQFDEWNSETPAKIPDRLGKSRKFVKKAKVIR